MRIGIDLGGTKISAIALDGGGQVSFHQHTATPREDYHATIEATGALVARIDSATRCRGSVGVGIIIDGRVLRGAARLWPAGAAREAGLP